MPVQRKCPQGGFGKTLPFAIAPIFPGKKDLRLEPQSIHEAKTHFNRKRSKQYPDTMSAQNQDSLNAATTQVWQNR